VPKPLLPLVAFAAATTDSFFAAPSPALGASAHSPTECIHCWSVAVTPARRSIASTRSVCITGSSGFSCLLRLAVCCSSLTLAHSPFLSLYCLCSGQVRDIYAYRSSLVGDSVGIFADFCHCNLVDRIILAKPLARQSWQNCPLRHQIATPQQYHVAFYRPCSIAGLHQISCTSG
jgi:hypothetical protein